MMQHARASEPPAAEQPAPVAYRMSEPVREALGRLGRTEDAQFSPSGRRLAIAGFAHQRILVLDVTLNLTAGTTGMTFETFMELESAAHALPHGLFWLDEQTLIVANRCGEVAIFAVPSVTACSTISIEPLRTLGLAQMIDSPGSVTAAAVAPDLVELLVCNNYVHTITRHLLDRRANFEPIASEVLLKQGLEVPDGIAQSASGRWIAVSNHYRNAVYLYRNDHVLDRASRPAGVLRGMRYPHGVRFSPDELSIVVADAGTPFVHVFRTGNGQWFGERNASETIRAVSDEVFLRGHSSREEGGPKGIDLTADGSLMVASCEEQTLAIFDMRGVFGATTRPAEELDATRAREALLRYARGSASPLKDAARLALGDLRHSARLLFVRFAWRLTRPLLAFTDKFVR